MERERDTERDTERECERERKIERERQRENRAVVVCFTIRPFRNINQQLIRACQMLNRAFVSKHDRSCQMNPT